MYYHGSSLGSERVDLHLGDPFVPVANRERGRPVRRDERAHVEAGSDSDPTQSSAAAVPSTAVFSERKPWVFATSEIFGWNTHAVSAMIGIIDAPTIA